MCVCLVFVCCININFDIYLIDEVILVGDFKFRKKVWEVLEVKVKEVGLIMVSYEID